MAKFDLNLPEKEPDEIILNRHGDKISVSADDAGLWHRFLEGCKEIVDMSNGFSDNIRGIGEQNLVEGDFDSESSAALSASAERVSYCSKAAESIDRIFGEGTVRKSFRDDYEAIPDFVPDEGKIVSFFNTMTPIMEEIFGKKMDEIEKMNQESKASMAKYIPQGHKRKEKKGKK